MNYCAGVAVLFGVGTPVACVVGTTTCFVVGLIVADIVLIVGAMVALGVVIFTVGVARRIIGVGTVVGVGVGVTMSCFNASASFFAASARELVTTSPTTATIMSSPIPDTMTTIWEIPLYACFIPVYM